MKKILIINGPNLNLLGMREEVYGEFNLSQIKKLTNDKTKDQAQLEWFEANSEGSIVLKVQSLLTSGHDGLVINPGALSHYSIALLDALRVIKLPIVEVHLSQIYRREDFRQRLLTAQASSIIMTGLKEKSYYFAVLALTQN